jgi:hypothetical protein
VIAMLAIGVGVPVLAKAGLVPDWFLKFVLFVYFPVGIVLWITYYEGWWGGPDSNSN